MSFKVGDKAIVALGKFRGADRYNGEGSLPERMLPDGSIVTITMEANTILWYKVAECGYSYPPSLLLPCATKKHRLLQAIKDFK